MACAFAIPSGHRVAFFPVWFFALGMTANGLFHPAFAIATRGYFPGLLSAPVVGILGVLMLERLVKLTRS